MSVPCWTVREHAPAIEYRAQIHAENSPPSRHSDSKRAIGKSREIDQLIHSTYRLPVGRTLCFESMIEGVKLAGVDARCIWSYKDKVFARPCRSGIYYERVWDIYQSSPEYSSPSRSLAVRILAIVGENNMPINITVELTSNSSIGWVRTWIANVVAQEVTQEVSFDGSSSRPISENCWATFPFFHQAKACWTISPAEDMKHRLSNTPFKGPALALDH